VTVEIDPEPTPEERQALLAALARLDGKPRHASPWWDAGIREAVEGDAEELLAGPAASGQRAAAQQAGREARVVEP
jgi:hypothetical protein